MTDCDQTDLHHLRYGVGNAWCAILRGPFGWYILETVSQKKADCHRKLKEYIAKHNAALEQVGPGRIHLKNYEECRVAFVSIYPRDTKKR